MSPKDPEKTTEQDPDYEQWFQDEVAAGLAELDDPATEWVQHDAAMKELHGLRLKIEAQIAARKKNDFDRVVAVCEQGKRH